MGTRIFIWQTIRSAFSWLKNNFSLLLKGLTIPFVIFVVAGAIPFIVGGGDPGSIFMARDTIIVESDAPIATPAISVVSLLCSFIQYMAGIWMMNTCYRLTITGDAGKKWWSMAETKVFGWLILLGITVNLVLGIPAAAIYFILAALGMTTFGVIGAALFYTLAFSYLAGRISMFIPSIAVGENMSLKNAWRMTENNGWRIIFTLVIMTILLIISGIALLAILSIVPALLGSLLNLHAPLMLAAMGNLVTTGLIAGFTICLNNIALGIIYKQLKLSQGL